jgi:hypothetical protein
MPKYLFLLFYLLPTSAFTKEALKNFHESLNDSIINEVSLDEEKFRGRSPASIEGSEELIEEIKNIPEEPSIMKKNLVTPEKW